MGLPWGRGPADARHDTDQRVLVGGRNEPRYTSIESTFNLLMLTNKLMGGCLIDVANSRLVAMIYRLAMTIAAKALILRFFTPHTHFHEETMPKSSTINMNIFFVLYVASSALATLVTMFTSGRYHKTLTLITRKRFDGRYLKSLDSQMREAAAAHEDLGGTGSKSSLRAKNSSRWFSRFAHWLRRSIEFQMWRIRAVRMRFVAGDQMPEMSRVSSSTNLNRCMIGFYIASTAVLSLIREEYGNSTIAWRLMSAPSGSNQSSPGQTSRLPEYLTISDNQWLNSAVQRHTGYLQTINQKSWLRFAAIFLKDLSGLFPAHLLLSSLNFFQVFGNVCIGMLSIACMTDMLRRANEQDNWTGYTAGQTQKRASEARETPAAIELRRDGRGPHRQRSCTFAMKEMTKRETSSSSHRPPRVESLPPPALQRRPVVTQTSDLLIQVRDVLITLRVALSVDYLVIWTYDISRLMSAFGFFYIFVSTRQLTWAFIVVLEYARICLGVVLIRLGSHLLHEEARKIRVRNHQRLVSNADVDGTSGTKLTAHQQQPPATASAGVSRVASLESPPRVGQLHIKHSSRIEAITNFRLAREIEEIWPTNWFVPDIKSCLAQNFFVIAFVATLQQLVEVRQQIK